MKKILTTPIFAILLFLLLGGGVAFGVMLVGGSGDIQLQKGLVGHWQFNGNAKDSSPYENHGKLEVVLGEAGSFVSKDNGEWATIQFRNSYIDPVVVGARNSQSGTDGIIIESRNVGPDSAEIRSCGIKYNPPGDGCRGDEAGEDIGYLVIDADATSQVPGIDAGKFNTDRVLSSTETINFNESFSSAPLVFASVQSINGPSPIEARVTATTATDFDAGLCKMDNNDEDNCASPHPEETIGWVAIDDGALPFDQSSGAGSLISGNDAWEPIAFSFASSPILMVEVQGYDGPQDVIVGEARNITSSGADIRFCEFDYNGQCDTHTTETLAWLAIPDGPLTYELPSNPTLTADRFGDADSAYNFSGSGEYIDFSPYDASSIKDGSFSVWIKTNNSNSGNKRIVEIGGGSNRIGLFMDNGQVYLYKGGGGINLSTPSQYSDNAWYHIVGVWNDSEAKIYVDGVEVASVAGDKTTNLSSESTGYIGQYVNGGNYYFTGLIDDVRIYNRAINENEISSLHESRGPVQVEIADTQKGLIGHWKLNGDANDATPYENHGTVNGATPTTDRKGRGNGAYNFSTGDYLNMGSGDSLKEPTEEITISAWVETTSLNDQWTPFVLGGDGIDAGNWQEMAYLLWKDGSELDFVIRVGGDSRRLRNVNLPSNEWVHIVGVYDGQNQYIYVNGKLENSRAQTGPIDYSNISDFRTQIGGRNDGYDWYEGGIDDVRIYDRALAGQEIKDIYDSYNPVLAVSDLHRGLVGHWTLQGDAKDRTPYTNHGTVNGATLTTDRRGRADSAYNFDGSGDYIEAVNPINSIEGSTLSFWVKFHNNSRWDIGTRSGSSNRFHLGYDHGDQEFLAGLGADHGWINSNLDKDTWYFMTLVGDAGTGRLYVDGNEIGSFPYTDQTPNSPFGIGRRINYSSPDVNPLDGKIDDVRIYNRALIDQEVKMLFETYR